VHTTQDVRHISAIATRPSQIETRRVEHIAAPHTEPQGHEVEHSPLESRFHWEGETTAWEHGRNGYSSDLNEPKPMYDRIGAFHAERGGELPQRPDLPVGKTAAGDYRVYHGMMPVRELTPTEEPFALRTTAAAGQVQYRIKTKVKRGYDLPSWHVPLHDTLESAQAEMTKLQEWDPDREALPERVIQEVPRRKQAAVSQDPRDYAEHMHTSYVAEHYWPDNIPKEEFRHEEAKYQRHFNDRIADEGIQHPVEVMHDHTGTRIWDGLHRVIAAEELGLPSVPVMFHTPGGMMKPSDFRAKEMMAKYPRLQRNQRQASDSGDRYVACDRGHEHWGAHGAAGLLVRHTDDQGTRRYLLQQRTTSGDVTEQGTWSTPGGALHAGESPEQGAMREATEELGHLHPEMTHAGTHVNDHGGWRYHTVVMDSPERFEPPGHGGTSWETEGHGWFTPGEMRSWTCIRALERVGARSLRWRRLSRSWRPATTRVTWATGRTSPAASEAHPRLGGRRAAGRQGRGPWRAPAPAGPEVGGLQGRHRRQRHPQPDLHHRGPRRGAEDQRGQPPPRRGGRAGPLAYPGRGPLLRPCRAAGHSDRPGQQADGDQLRQGREHWKQPPETRTGRPGEFMYRRQAEEHHEKTMREGIPARPSAGMLPGDPERAVYMTADDHVYHAHPGAGQPGAAGWRDRFGPMYKIDVSGLPLVEDRTYSDPATSAKRSWMATEDIGPERIQPHEQGSEHGVTYDLPGGGTRTWLPPKSGAASYREHVEHIHPRDLLPYAQREAWRVQDPGGRRHISDLAEGIRQRGYQPRLHGGMSGDTHSYPPSFPITLVHDVHDSWLWNGHHRTFALNGAGYDKPVPVLVKDFRKQGAEDGGGRRREGHDGGPGAACRGARSPGGSDEADRREGRAPQANAPDAAVHRPDRRPQRQAPGQAAGAGEPVGQDARAVHRQAAGRRDLGQR
jgi:8-oxo-dGTP pyrophosphatase MutT (NUDIX family)